jgi:hypothetical protein
MPPKTPGTSYTGKPVRKLKLPKIGPSKTKNLFEEYFYALLAVVFVAVAILGKAGGFSSFNALVVGAWITAALWFASQWKGYVVEKEKAPSGKALPAGAAAQTGATKGPMQLPPGMKPMIGPQWPVKPALWPMRPSLPKRSRSQVAQAPNVQAPNGREADPSIPTTPNDPNKKMFVYERPTLPDRKPKLPNNWKKTDKKKPKR